MFFNLYDYIDIIKVKNNYALIDVKHKNFFDLTKNQYNILRKCKNGKDITKVSTNLEFLNILLGKLAEQKIGYFSDKPIKATIKKLPTNKLDMVWLNITENCNYKCIHCYENACPKKADSVMTLKDYDLFLKLITKNHSIFCIQITGGEPLSKGKKFVFDLVKIIKKFNFNELEIFTNLSLVDDEYIDFFKKNNIKIATSFYSKNSEIHDEITGIKGSQQKSLRIIQQLVDNDVPVRIGVVIMNKNKDEAQDLRQWLNHKFGLDEKKQYDVVRPMGRGINSENVPMALFEEKFVNKNKLNYYDFDRYFYNKQFNSCWGNKICLKSNGLLYPCVMSSIVLGKFQKVNKLISKNNSYRFLTKDKIKVCKDCKFKYLCDECRAMNECYTKKLKEKPFTCHYNPKIDKWENLN